MFIIYWKFFIIKCSNGCGYTCTSLIIVTTTQKPSASKAGVCPPRPGIGKCVVRCRNDASCPGNEKCVCYLSKISICLLFIENSS